MVKLTTRFCIFRSADDEDRKNAIERLVNEIRAFAQIGSNWAVWEEFEGECVYMRRVYGCLDCGEKISGREIPKVVASWASAVADWCRDDPDEGIGFDEADGEQERGDGKRDLAHRQLKIEIKDNSGGHALDIAAYDSDGELADELSFVEASPIDGHAGDAED